MYVPLLPFLLFMTGLALAVLVLHLARRSGEERRWFPWLLVLLLPFPLYLQLLRLEFLGMLSIYLTWPATSGPLALLLPYFVSLLGWRDPFFWLLALGLALLWLALIRQLWLRRQGLAAAAWFLGMLLAAIPLYLWLLPPD